MAVSSSLPQEVYDSAHDWSEATYEDCEEDVVMQLTSSKSFKLKDQDNDASKCTIDIVLGYKGFTCELPDQGHIDSTDELLFEYASYITIVVRKLDDILSRHEEVKKEVNEFFQLYDNFTNELSDYIIDFASSEYITRKEGHNFLQLKFDVSLVHFHSTFLLSDEEEEEEIDYVATCMVPATNDSIKNLKRKRIHEDSDQNCVICLDELSEGHDVVLMPCSHPFHGDCIEEWLNTSHYCPICRFKLPRRSSS